MQTMNHFPLLCALMTTLLMLMIKITILYLRIQLNTNDSIMCMYSDALALIEGTTHSLSSPFLTKNAQESPWACKCVIWFAYVLVTVYACYSYVQ